MTSSTLHAPGEVVAPITQSARNSDVARNSDSVRSSHRSVSSPLAPDLRLELPMIDRLTPSSHEQILAEQHRDHSADYRREPVEELCLVNSARYRGSK